MRTIRLGSLLGAALAVAACSDQPTAPAAGEVQDAAPLLRAPDRAFAIDGSYIVVLKEGVAPSSVAGEAGVDARLVYTSVLNGFAADLTPRQLAALRRNPAVDYVEEDQRGAIATTQSGATWGIDRIDQRNRPLSGTYTYTNDGTGVRAYVIDSGIQANHPQFGSRAQAVYDYAGGSGADCNGHGTHVSGTIGSATYGVAKNAYLRGVRVTDCAGGSSVSITVAGIDWVRNNHIKPAVANMSLGFPYSSSMNTAVYNLSNAGVFVAVAAGNENQAACNVSPASSSGAFTVAASTSSDARASYSNHGGCVDLYAPGSSVKSTWTGSGTNTISGTSMASPHVAGVAALYKDAYGDASSSTIRSWLINNSTANVISGNVSGTPNRLLYKSSL